jgi:outer membrane protein assembly factor BamB
MTMISSRLDVVLQIVVFALAISVLFAHGIAGPRWRQVARGRLALLRALRASGFGSSQSLESMTARNSHGPRETVLARWRLHCVCHTLVRGMLPGLVGAATAMAGDSWPAFHNGGNTSVEAKNLPAHWSPEHGSAWKVELPGYGQSSPVVWKDRVYVTSIQGDEKELCLLFAVDLATGKIVWQREFPSSVRLKYAEMVSRAAPTPLIDANGIYVFFESGDLHALTHDGTPCWHNSLFDAAENAYQNNHGYGASPAQTDDAVIVLVDHKGPSYLLSVAKETGKTLWKTERTSRSSWSSPRVARIGGQDQVVVSSGGSVDGYEAGTGKSLWSYDGINGNTIPSASVVGDLVFVGASQARGGPSEAAAASNCCLRITPGKEASYEVLWKAEKALCSYVSPLIHRGHAYYVNSVGVLYCLDAATGRQVYAERIEGGSCWAQPIAAGDLIYFFGKKGVTTVVRAGSTFEQVASNRLWPDDAPPQRAVPQEKPAGGDEKARPAGPESMDPVVYGVAAVDDAFVVRLGTHLFRIGGSRAATVDGPAAP